MLRRLQSFMVALIALSALVSGEPVVSARQSFAADPPLNILVINSFHPDIPWQRSFENGLKGELERANKGAQLFLEYLYSGRISEESYFDELRDYLESKYKTIHVDVVITESRSAQRFLSNSPNLFSGSKRLYIQPGDILEFPSESPNAAITVANDFGAAISEMQRLLSPQKVFVIADASEPSRQKRLEAFKAALVRERRDFETEFLIDLPMAKLLDRVADLPSDSAIFYLLIFKDGGGESFVPYQAAQLIAARANAPMFSNWESLLGSGIVGGYMLSGEQVGKGAAGYALALALGDTDNVQGVQGYGYYYDWRQLKRWNINEKSLPNNASIQFYQPTLIEKYRWQITTTFLVLAALLLLSTSLLMSVLKRKKTEQELKDSEERLALVLEGSRQGFWDWNIETGKVFRNDHWAQMLGYSSIDEFEANTDTWTDNIHPDDRDAAWGAINDHLEGRTPIYQVEYRMFTKSGEIVWIRDQAKIVNYDESGRPCRMCGTHTDITKLKKIEDDLRNSNEELSCNKIELEQRVDERTREINEKKLELEEALESEKKYTALQKQFVSLVSHELRTPLTIIDSGIQRLIRRKNEVTADELESRGNKIRNAVERMVGLIETVLYADSLAEGKIPFNPDVRDLKAIISIACEHQAEISSNHEIRVDVGLLPPAIYADWKLLNQVFQNLLSNAVKYSPSNPLIEVKGWTENNNAMVSVSDHGVGISANDLPKIFQRFFRAETSQGFNGTGLGLNVSKEFVLMHGGDISVQSTEGEGTTFIVKLPIGNAVKWDVAD